MLRVLYIQNFQNQTKTKVVFDEKVTTIVGSSDRGKSAILRALRWLCLNSPQGSAFIQDGKNGTAVKLEVEDHLVTRKKGSENLYKLDDQVYKAFGSKVPEDIENALAVTDLNFQQQHDAPFWLSLSSAEVSRQLNEIVDLSVIDNSLAKSKKQTKDAQAELQICSKRMKETAKSKKELGWVLDAEERWTHLKAQHTEILARMQYNADLQQTQQSIRTAKQMQQTANVALERAQDLQSKASKIRTREDKLDKLCDLVRRIRENENAKAPDFSKVQNKAEAYTDEMWQRNALRDFVVNAKQLQEERDDLHSQLAQARQKLDSVEVCPVCERKL